jgi:hypothetical protein
MIKHGEII